LETIRQKIVTGAAILVSVPLVFICGGSRSGKSSKAMEMALASAERPAFIATAEPLDEEMRERIAHHKEERGDRFETLEVPVEVAGTLQELAPRHKVVVVDCLTLWLSNVMLREGADIAGESARLIEALRAFPGTVIAVSNEVGCGIVPENALARQFRDESGRLNAGIAKASDEVYWMVFGCALRVK
jgi:adenosylcobinamide kinase/adenosylcobinamide-phosphate guanylyltransferase